MIRCPSCGSSYQPERGDLVRVGELEIDYRSWRVTVGGEYVPLQRQAFKLLSVLASDPGRVFSDLALYRAAWGGRLMDNGTIRSHMARLRRSLGPDVPIRNVHGVGYVLDVESLSAGGAT